MPPAAAPSLCRGHESISPRAKPDQARRDRRTPASRPPGLSPAALEWVATGTQKGDMPGMTPASNKVASVLGVSVAECADGKIKHNADYWDMATVMKQLCFWLPLPISSTFPDAARLPGRQSDRAPAPRERGRPCVKPAPVPHRRRGFLSTARSLSAPPRGLARHLQSPVLGMTMDGSVSSTLIKGESKCRRQRFWRSRPP
jgi:hypothetical protein